MNKICSKCKQTKPIDSFSKRKDRPCGRISKCKACQLEYARNNREHINNTRKIARQKSPEKSREYRKQQYWKHRAKELASSKEWRELHKEERREYKKQYQKQQRISSLNFKIQQILRNRINSALYYKYAKKAFKSIELLGCSIEYLRQHLESQFKEGMSWDNHGLYGWHIDHIKPCAAFDLTIPEQQKECFHFTNLQPLWAKENLFKKDKLLSYYENNNDNKK